MTAADTPAPQTGRGHPPRMPVPPLRVVRLASVFEPADPASHGVSFDPVGGMQNHTAELVRCLDRMGVRQTLFTSRLGGPAGRSRCGEHAVVVRTGLKVPLLRQLWAPPALAAALRIPGAVDVVHAHAGEDLAVLPAARAVANRHGCPLVVTLHCSLRHTLRGGSPREAALRLLGGAVERRTAAGADAVIALTPSTARRLAGDGVPAERIHAIPSGFAPDLFTRERPDPFPYLPRPRVAYVGRLAAQKDVGTLLDAFARLPSGGARLLVVGDGPQRAQLQARARPLSDRVHFTGFLPHEQVPAVLAHVDVLVVPSRYEELGSVLVEAMAAGLPVVASRVGGIPDLVRDGHNGLLVPPGDAAAFARAVGRLLGDPATAARLGREARHTAGAYAWPLLAEKVAGVYHRVVAAHAGRRRR
ncbi:glycosyltransferase family 4 protein [Streptomyces radiopugnans]|uniref:glycosyltransferase family 4 protein n=1 Tax=Streptomyces radiopugnans TaxID=403935 RepID=UPI003F1D39DF